MNALGFGALELIKKNTPSENITILGMGIDKKSRIIDVQLNKEEILNLNYIEFTKKEYLLSGIESIFYKTFKIEPKLEISKLMLDTDILFDVNEGDSFSDIYGFKRFFRHFLDSFISQQWKVKTVFLPQTIGPFNTKLVKYLAIYLLKHLDKLFVRDAKAIELFKSNNIPYTLNIDMAVFMKPIIPEDITIKSNCIGININGLMYLDSYTSLKGKYQNYKIFMKNLIIELQRKGFNIILVPHTYNKKTPILEDDLIAIKNFIKDYNLKDIDYVNKTYTAQELKGIISQTDFFIGSRMHSCIAGLSNGIPTIGYAYSYKFEGTFKMFGLEDHVLNIQEEKEEDIINKTIKLIDNRLETKTKLENFKKNNKQYDIFY